MATTPAFIPRYRKQDAGQRLKEIFMFFQGKDPVHETMARVVRALEAAGIPYLVAGGMAVAAHRHRRTTDDVDVLLTAEGLERFRQILADHHFAPWTGFHRRFIDQTNDVTFDVMQAGGYPGSGKPGPIVYPDPTTAVPFIVNDVRYIDLPTLVQLKLAARRHQDFADVIALIRENHLDEGFQDQLHPSVRQDYVECLEEMRREDEYARRQDQAED
jgi:hypothetical protein